jgi:GntR family transcriptional regulator
MEERSVALILIDYRDHRPIYEQVVERFKDLILKGALEANSQLPSVRNLAMELSINPNTIQRAYAELERQGYIYSIKGKGNFIAAGDLIFREKQAEIFQQLEDLAREAKGIRIPKDKIIAVIDESYGEEKDDD